MKLAGQFHMAVDMAFNGELFNIFSWLPAKSIIKFTSLCQSSNKLLSEDFFIKEQCKNMALKDDLSFSIQPNSCQRYKDKVEFHTLSYDDSSSTVVPYKSLHFLSNAGRVLASSNGLLCCRNIIDNQTGLFICNPTTKTWFSIPAPEGLKLQDSDFKIVFECKNDLGKFPDDYLLMVLLDTYEWSSNFLCKIYSPKEGTWRENGTINAGARSILSETPVYHNGVVYFISDCFSYLSKNSPFYWPYIVSYDTQTFVSSFMKIPKDARRGLHDPACRLCIFRWGSAEICLVKQLKSVFSMWVLTDQSSSSWKRVLKMRVRAMGVTERDPKVAGFTVLNGHSLVFATEEKVYKYRLSGGRSERAEEICRHECGRNVFFNAYSNALRPCGDGATPLPT
ncbi:unnamed protein product [Ilex paraguariensis]|uniref:F-box associated beta-propeller type 3 domain-containing protein n=1 Tax=Ilex paraguariensis TaxID=185542 RepID=A0ABC8QRI9_9AQUA